MTETCLRGAPVTGMVETSRRLAARTMRTWSLLEREEPVTAIVAELVANAVRHARTPLELCLRRLPGRIRVEVKDGSTTMPRLSFPKPLEEGRRGLFLVSTYATTWGVDPTPEGGKIVWAEVAL
jgi:anti-sigma regulatory factor (Ser/Thr protein kinase)